MCRYYCIEFINYMFKNKTFLLMILKRMIKLLKEYLNMNNIELADINNYRLNEINKTKDYFNNEINEGKDIIKKLNKYIVGFDYLDKIFIALSASFGTLSITSQATVVGILVGIAGASFTLIFTISTGVNKSLLQVTKKTKKEHNKIIALAKSKFKILIKRTNYKRWEKKLIVYHVENIKNINARIVRNKHNRSMIQSNCAICNSKKSIFIKEHQASRLLSNLGIKTPLNKVPLLNILL